MGIERSLPPADRGEGQRRELIAADRTAASATMSHAPKRQISTLGGVSASPSAGGGWGGLLERKPTDADRNASSDAAPVVAFIAPRIRSRADV